MAEPTCEEQLKALLDRRAKLIVQATSGIAEIEQPMLGRTQYRTAEDMGAALRLLDSQICALAAACGLQVPGITAAKARRPIYPVVQEL